MTASPRRAEFVDETEFRPSPSTALSLGGFGRSRGAEREVSPVHALDECEQRPYWDKIER